MDRKVDHRRARGQVLVMFAGGLIALIAVVGLVIDGGNVFFNRRDDQNASDLASLAGTKRLYDYYTKNTAFTTTDNVYSAVQKSLQANGCVAANGCTWTAKYVGDQIGTTFPVLGTAAANDTALPNGAGAPYTFGVRVDIQTQPKTYFLGVFGRGSWDVRTTAIAMTRSYTTVAAGDLLPIALVDGQNLTEGTIYSLTSGSNGPGNFGWVSWDGSNSAGSLATSICTPNNPSFSLPYQFPGDPGKTNASDVRACLQYWVDNKATILIPIVYAPGDPAAPAGCSTGGNGNNFHYCIKRVVAFVLTGYAQPAVDQIQGRFDPVISYNPGQTVPAGGSVPPTSTSVNEFGLAK
jgi:Flp pilus assembly protein TadG